MLISEGRGIVRLKTHAKMFATRHMMYCFEPKCCIRATDKESAISTL